MMEKKVPKVVHDIDTIREEIVKGGLDGEEFCPDLMDEEGNCQCDSCELYFYCGDGDTADVKTRRNLLISYLVDNSYITKGQALDLTLIM